MPRCANVVGGFMAMLMACGAAGSPGAARGAEGRPRVEEFLHSGRFAEGEKTLSAELKKTPDDGQLRFGLGALQFLQGVEHLGQAFYRHGLRSDVGNGIPLLRMPVPDNPEPASLNYAQTREILERFVTDLAKAEATLAQVRDDDVKLPLNLAAVRFDFDGDGQSQDTFAAILARYVPAARGGQNAEAEPLAITFDRGDVAWLRGYCHLLTALCEAALAYDGSRLFEHTAHLFFAKPETPFDFLGDRGRQAGGFDYAQIADLVAMVHLVQLPLKEPERLASAHAHLEQMLALSRESWKFIAAETDDDAEWIPNPQQQSITGIEVTQPIVDGWLAFVDEAEAILAGKRLVPFWRGSDGRGINLRRVFTEPQTFDLVLWVQGTAAAPYLEAGELTRGDTWNRLLEVFGGNFIGFAVWFN